MEVDEATCEELDEAMAVDVDDTEDDDTEDDDSEELVTLSVVYLP